MANERRTVEDCLTRMRAAEELGKHALATYWSLEAQRTRMLELAAAPQRMERRRERGRVVDLLHGPEVAL
jgi:hypothetical protein